MTVPRGLEAGAKKPSETLKIAHAVSNLGGPPGLRRIYAVNEKTPSHLIGGFHAPSSLCSPSAVRSQRGVVNVRELDIGTKGIGFFSWKTLWISMNVGSKPRKVALVE